MRRITCDTHIACDVYLHNTYKVGVSTHDLDHLAVGADLIRGMGVTRTAVHTSSTTNMQYPIAANKAALTQSVPRSRVCGALYFVGRDLTSLTGEGAGAAGGG